MMGGMMTQVTENQYKHAKVYLKYGQSILYWTFHFANSELFTYYKLHIK